MVKVVWVNTFRSKAVILDLLIGRNTYLLTYLDAVAANDMNSKLTSLSYKALVMSCRVFDVDALITIKLLLILDVPEPFTLRMVIRAANKRKVGYIVCQSVRYVTTS